MSSSGHSFVVTAGVRNIEANESLNLTTRPIFVLDCILLPCDKSLTEMFHCVGF